MHAPSPFSLNFQDLLRIATAREASDLHVEPFAGSLRVRARIHGVLTLLQELHDARLAERLAHQVKKACGFDMAKLGIPQDARFCAEPLPFDVRASLIPTLHGEKFVLRFLPRNKRFSLSDYPMPESARAHLRLLLEKSQGLILVSGPTGSGKTTLLYSALAEIDRIANNVHTLEDPVEYTLAGVSQTQIVRPTLTFAQALSALMRQDPDCILVGEIRDEETARAALHAASTGHLVFSTVHANSAKEILTRMQGLGVEPQLLLANLLFASAQRLVPALCPECRRPAEESRLLVQAHFGCDIVPMQADGCVACRGTGIAGRVLLFEYLARTGHTHGEDAVSSPSSPESSQADDHQRKDPLLQQYGSLREAALHNLKQGVIDVPNACAYC